ncbi:MAG: hypothetical protein R3C11_24310 [Planctomycetaceae bacterium]
MGDAADFRARTEMLNVFGGTEDGYAAIDFALRNYPFRPGAAVNIVID